MKINKTIAYAIFIGPLSLGDGGVVCSPQAKKKKNTQQKDPIATHKNSPPLPR